MLSVFSSTHPTYPLSVALVGGASAERVVEDYVGVLRVAAGPLPLPIPAARAVLGRDMSE